MEEGSTIIFSLGNIFQEYKNIFGEESPPDNRQITIPETQKS